MMAGLRLLQGGVCQERHLGQLAVDVKRGPHTDLSMPPAVPVTCQSNLTQASDHAGMHRSGSVGCWEAMRCVG